MEHLSFNQMTLDSTPDIGSMLFHQWQCHYTVDVQTCPAKHPSLMCMYKHHLGRIFLLRMPVIYHHSNHNISYLH